MNIAYYCSVVWAALFQYSVLNQLLAGERNSDVDGVIILCSFEHLSNFPTLV